MEVIRLIELNRLDESAQTRAGLRPNAIADYAEKLLAGEKLNPAIVYEDGEQLFLAAGFHRLAAHREAKLDRMPCEVPQGSRWDAIKAGIADNLMHLGERLSRADKQHNIRLVLREHPELSDRAIGELVGVEHRTVARQRTELTGEIPQSRLRTGRDGRSCRVPENGPKSGWVKFPFPELRPDHRYVAVGCNNDVVEIDPHPYRPEIVFVSHGSGSQSKRPLGNHHGIRHTHFSIEDLLKGSNFIPGGPWVCEESFENYPAWFKKIPIWEFWSEQCAILDFFYRYGTFPGHRTWEFWDEVDALLDKVRSSDIDASKFEANERFRLFRDEWQSRADKLRPPVINDNTLPRGMPRVQLSA